MDEHKPTNDDLADALNGTGKFASPYFPSPHALPAEVILAIIGHAPNCKCHLLPLVPRTREEREAEGWRELEQLSRIPLTR